jgi:4-carboxymuconolactone decarboxylase
MTKEHEARIAPLEESEYTEEMRELLAAGTPDGQPRTAEFLRILVRHPKLYKRWAAWGTLLLARGQLLPRVRELVILRTAWRCQAEIEWAEHVEIAKDEGVLSSEEIEQVITGPDAPAWSPADTAILRAVDELLSDACLTDGTWDELARILEPPQIIELFMLLGNYTMLAWIQKSLRVPLRHGLVGLDAR